MVPSALAAGLYVVLRNAVARSYPPRYGWGGSSSRSFASSSIVK